MAYTEEMTISEILLRLASIRNELLQAVNDIEKISKNICYKAKQTEPQIDCYMCKWLGEVNVCGRCRNRNLFAEANTKPQTINLGNGFSITANDCDTCKYDISEDDYDLYDMCEPMIEGECKYEPKDKPQTDLCEHCHFKGYSDWCDTCRHAKTKPQTIRCPKCGRTDYIREFGKDFSVTAEEAGFKYKCINCNTYIEPQIKRSE